MLSRTQPTPIDLGVAIAGGLAATFALVQPKLSAALPGVAIATALMPPLCVIGVGVAPGDWDVAQGALLLFLTNAVAIAASSTFLFYITGFSLGRKDEGGWIPRSLQISIILVVILLAPLGWQSYVFVRDASVTREINQVVVEEVEKIGATLDRFSWSEDTDNDILVMEMTLLVPESLNYQNSVDLQDAIAVRLQRTVQLKINQVNVAQLDPLSTAHLDPNARRSSPPEHRPSRQRPHHYHHPHADSHGHGYPNRHFHPHAADRHAEDQHLQDQAAALPQRPGDRQDPPRGAFPAALPNPDR